MALKELSFLELELFVALGDLKSVRALARERGLNPAQVSKSLKRIEEKVGTTLFNRTALGVFLTPEGVLFRKNAKTILGQLPLLAMKGGLKRPKTRIYSIGSTNLMNVHLLPRALTRVNREHPEARFRVLDVAPDQIVNLGLRGLIDLAIHWDPLKWTSLWDSNRVGELKYGLFARRGHPLLPTSRPDQVRTFPFLLPVYLQNTSVRFGDDRCPIPQDVRISGDQTSSAASAVKIAANSDQLMFVPRIVADGSDLLEVQVEGWKSVKQSIYLSVNAQTVQKSIADALALALQSVAT